MPSSDAGLSPLIREGSPVFAAIAVACLLVGGIAGVAGDDEPGTQLEPTAVAATADHGHGATGDIAVPSDGHDHVAVGGADPEHAGASGGHAGDHAHGSAAPASSSDAAVHQSTASAHGAHQDAGTGTAAAGSDHTGADHTGTDHTGTDHTGTDHAGTERSADGEGHVHATGCADGHPVTVALVQQVQANLVSTYKDVATLVALGYHPYFDSLVPGGYPPGGEGISHWINPNYIDDGIVLDPQRPETILLDNWNWPIGMMFINDPGVAPIPVYTNGDGTACSPWHPHTDAPARFGWYYYRAVYDRQMEGEVPAQTPEMMHVWAIHNPAGVYAAHDYPPSEERQGPPGPIPSYFSEATIPGT